MKTLEDLYTCFEKYKPTDLDCCSCCHEPEFVKALTGDKLRTLGETKMYDYFCSALYTCSGTSAFKYFLPRLFELFPDELWQFQAKFEYVHWENWDELETSTIKKHVRALWFSGDYPCFFDDYISFFSFDEIFGFWDGDLQFLRECLPHVAYFKFKDLEEKNRAYELLENLFFSKADSDFEFAEELSVAASYVRCLPPWE